MGHKMQWLADAIGKLTPEELDKVELKVRRMFPGEQYKISSVGMVKGRKTVKVDLKDGEGTTIQLG